MLTLLVCAVSPGVPARGPPVLVVDPAQAMQPLGTRLLVIADPGSDWTLEQVARGEHDDAALPLRRAPPSLGYPRRAHWVRLLLTNPGDTAIDRLLVLRRGSKYAQDLLIDSAGVQRRLHIGAGGDSVSGDLRSRHAVVRLALPARSRTHISIRFDTRISAVLDYRLYQEAAFAHEEWRDQWVFGCLAGFGAAISGFVLLIGWLNREPLYLWFTAAATTAIGYILYYEGYLALGITGTYEPALRLFGTVVGVGGIACYIWFTRLLLEARQQLPAIDRWLLRPLVWIALPIIGGVFVAPWPATGIGAVWALLAVPLTGSVVLWAAWRGHVRERGFLLATVLFQAVTVVYTLQLLGIVADDPRIHGGRIGTLALCMLTFAVVVSERVRKRQDEIRLAIQRNESRLAQMVAERTAELSAAKEHAEQALANLQTTQRQLVEAEKMASLGQLVAGVAHEVNTPLGVAVTASSFMTERTRTVARQLQQGDLRRSELHDYVNSATASCDIVGRNLDRAADLIRGFKQVSVDRTSDGRRVFNLRRFLLELLGSLEPLWKHRPVELALEIPDDIEFDSFPGALGQVVTNLFQNALVHAFDSEQHGVLCLRVQTADAGEVTMEVSDDGRGVDNAALARLFEPFYTTRRAHGGTGLGLHIVYNLVTQKLGGTIEASSRPGAGLQFLMRLPRVAPRGDDEHPA